MSSFLISVQKDYEEKNFFNKSKSMSDVRWSMDLVIIIKC